VQHQDRVSGAGLREVKDHRAIGPGNVNETMRNTRYRRKIAVVSTGSRRGRHARVLSHSLAETPTRPQRTCDPSSIASRQPESCAGSGAAIRSPGRPTPDADVPHFFDNPAGPDAPKRYLDLIEECVRSVDVPVIASINGTSRHGWTSFARNMQDAGAAAVECNFYNVPQRMQGPGRDVEARCMDVVHALKQELDVPVAVKLTPYFSSFGELALRLVETGADGLVLFNRFLQPGSTCRPSRPPP
jgi:hypothetical protein